MMNQLIAILMTSLLFFSSSFAQAPSSKDRLTTYVSTQETLKNTSPNAELARLKLGNDRFVNNKAVQRNLLQQAKITHTSGQFPGAIILSCMDSRSSPELIFDQGLGDIFSVRIAGNVVDTDQIGGMEYATKIVGSKLIVVMGHSQCGAVKGACQNVQLGNLTELLNKIQPAVKKVQEGLKTNINCNDYKTVDDIAKQNVIDMMQQVTEQSPIIREQIKNNEVLLVGAMHDLATGKVIFFDKNSKVL